MNFIEQIIQEVEQKGVVVKRDDVPVQASLNRDMSFPFLAMTLCTNGHARSLIDMREFTQKKNGLCILLPGHIVHPLEYSEDFTVTQMFVSQAMLDELPNYLFSHDYAKFHKSPVCSLTDVQAERLLAVVNLLAVVSEHTYEDLGHRKHVLLAQLSVGYEHVNYYRREQDKLLPKDTQTAIFAQFCDLVVEHYREHKDLSFYAEQMDYHPKYLSRVTGIYPQAYREANSA